MCNNVQPCTCIYPLVEGLGTRLTSLHFSLHVTPATPVVILQFCTLHSASLAWCGSQSMYRWNIVKLSPNCDPLRAVESSYRFQKMLIQLHPPIIIACITVARVSQLSAHHTSICGVPTTTASWQSAPLLIFADLHPPLHGSSSSSSHQPHIPVLAHWWGVVLVL